MTWKREEGASLSHMEVRDVEVLSHLEGREGDQSCPI